jgi:plasmid stabilization system protein ParE
VTKKVVVKTTASFERNLEDIERFLIEAEAPLAYDALLDELLGTVIRNLERFPGMGRPFLAREARSVEASNALAALRAKLSALTPDTEALREYIMDNYLVLYVQIDRNIHLLAIRHQRQLSFDFESNWGAV